MTFDAGFMWQETKRELKEQKIEAAVRIFAPLGVPAELMQVRVTNKSDMDMCVRVTSAIPIYGRSADNLRDPPCNFPASPDPYYRTRRDL